VNRCRLYLITPPALKPDAFAEQLETALAAGDVASVQLRLKQASDAEILHAGRQLMPIVQRAGAAFIINDRPDLASALGADGVHIGQEDATYVEARAAVGAKGIVGVTCHDSRHLAIEAAEAGADYVAFGAMFTTGTKQAKTRCELELIQWWAEMMVVPCVAIGGITVDNCSPVIDAGADFIAVSSGVWDFPEGPAAAIKSFNRLFSRVVPRGGNR
jgi:thiamine-phosphate pyrophosphorylase